MTSDKLVGPKVRLDRYKQKNEKDILIIPVLTLLCIIIYPHLCQVRLTLIRFLPGVFMDAMRDNAEAAVHIFEGTHENPELIWNDSSREKVSTTVREMMLEYDISPIQYPI